MSSTYSTFKLLRIYFMWRIQNTEWWDSIFNVQIKTERISQDLKIYILKDVQLSCSLPKLLSFKVQWTKPVFTNQFLGLLWWSSSCAPSSSSSWSSAATYFLATSFSWSSSRPSSSSWPSVSYRFVCSRRRSRSWASKSRSSRSCPPSASLSTFFWWTFLTF